MIRDVVVGACALAALACASGSGANTVQSGSQNLGTVQGNVGVQTGAGSGVVVHSQGATGIFTASDAAVVATVPAPVDMAYAAILTGYSGIKVEVLSADSRSHVAGNTRVEASGPILGKPLSQYFDCGMDGVTRQPRADNYRLTFSIVSSLARVDSATTRVTTLVTAAASNRALSGTDVHCASTGKLERALLRAAGYPAN